MKLFKNIFKSNKKNNDGGPRGKFEIVSIAYKDGQVKLETDWDEQFIGYLKENGYTGTDEQIIQKYLVLLNKQILQDMGEIDGNDFI